MRGRNGEGMIIVYGWMDGFLIFFYIPLWRRCFAFFVLCPRLEPHRTNRIQTVPEMFCVLCMSVSGIRITPWKED